MELYRQALEMVDRHIAVGWKAHWRTAEQNSRTDSSGWRYQFLTSPLGKSYLLPCRASGHNQTRSPATANGN